MDMQTLMAVIAASISGMLLGALWYSPMMFGKQWMRCLGKTPETLGSATLPMLGSMFACVLTAIGILLLQNLIQVDSLLLALQSGLVLALLIVFPALLSDNLFCGWGSGLLLIQSGYRMLTVLVMSVVLYWL